MNIYTLIFTLRLFKKIHVWERIILCEKINTKYYEKDNSEETSSQSIKLATANTRINSFTILFSCKFLKLK